MNTHLAIAIHALTLLSLENGGPLSATYMAGSINTHPVFLRRVLTALQKAGLVETQRGPHGGIRLLRPADRITLFDIYKAVAANEELFKLHPSPNPACPVGSRVQDVLENYFSGAEKALELFLSRVSVADVLESVRQQESAA